MGADRARKSYDPKQHYRSVVMQQGRVTLETDWNEGQSIFGEELRHEILDIMGPAGTPDDGYGIIVTGTAPTPPFDFSVSAGTMYVGGIRLVLDAPVQYSNQPDWLDHSGDHDWIMPAANNPADHEFVYLLVREQEVSAVEDSALREVALGGPDTAARTRMIQHIVRLPTGAADCAGGLKDAEAYWAKEGLVFHPATMRLLPQSKLQVSFGKLPAPDPCEPEATGGYLGADNQLIRVQITGPNTLVWGFDDASFLYRVSIDSTGKILTLQSQPVDAFHQPQANQAVEVLRSAALLSDGEYVASATGVVQTLTASYNQSTQQLTLPAALPGSYTDPVQTPRAFLRVWQQQIAFTPGTPVQLGNTGVFVTLTTAGGAPFHVSDYWMIAVRPSTPTQVYPAALLNGKEPDGPRMWACPLGAIEWDDGILKLDSDCRVSFCTLAEACGERGGGCCTVAVRPQDSAKLQSIIDTAVGSGKETTVIVCLAPGQYNLTHPLVLGPQHSGLKIEACGEDATIGAAAGSERNFLDGLIVLNQTKGVTLRGLTLRPPLVPFGAAGGGLANVPPALLRRIGIDLNHWMVSIGVRLLSSRSTTVEDCAFALPAGMEGDNANLFGAAILGAGQLHGRTTISRNSFSSKGELRANTSEPVRMLAGLMIAPSVNINLTSAARDTTIAAGEVSIAAAARAGIGGTVVAPVVEEALLAQNSFAGLDAAALIYANNGQDIGKLTIEDNSVSDCYAGFWIFGQSRIGALDLMLASQHAEPISFIASTIADAYPLPTYFKPAQPIAVASAALLTGQSAPANIKGLLLGLYELRAVLSAIETAAFPARAGAALSLMMSNNEINAIATTVDGGVVSGAAVFVAANTLSGDRLAGFSSTIVCSANKARNRTAEFPTVAVYAGPECTLTATGNLIFNLGGATGDAAATSLFVTGGGGTFTPAGAPPVIAVTGNVFRGPPRLPPRSLPAPLNTWDVFNTIV